MNHLKTLISFTWPVDAHIAAGFLESEGIRTYLKDEYIVQVDPFYSNAVGGVKIEVDAKDYEPGLKSLKNGGYFLPESREDIGIEWVIADKSLNKSICPFCSSDNIGRKKELDALTLLVYFIMGAVFPVFKKSYVCYDCEKVWKFKRS